MSHSILFWRTNSAGAIETLSDGFRLIVERLHHGPGASYAVGKALLPFWAQATGERSSVTEAMKAAEEIVAAMVKDGDPETRETFLTKASDTVLQNWASTPSDTTSTLPGETPSRRMPSGDAIEP